MNANPGGALPPSLDDPRVVEALEEYLADLESGQRPNRQAFLARHAEIAEPLAECLDGMEMLHEASSPSRAGGAADTADWQPGAALGDFRIVREIGRGGMGVVYEAEQLSLGRRIALKVLPFALTLDPRHLQRFKNEARAAAHLHHTNIVPIYSVGCERGVHFYAMQYIEGQTVAEVILGLRALAAVRSPQREQGRPPTSPQREQGQTASLARAAGSEDSPKTLARKSVEPTTTPYGLRAELPAPSAETTVEPRGALETAYSSGGPQFFRTVAELGVQAAEALEHAHEYGVVHRDVKPGNLMVDARGHLWIADFGLAQFQNDAALTLTGDLLGTLRYMSPEQALARRGLVDHRTDIYSLGATLYELLTLQPAYAGTDRQELLRQIALDEPRPPRRHNPAIPADLETIVLKAMAKGVEERYATARELADDLRRFLEQKPILARRPALLERAAKWSRRHRTAVTTAVVLLLLAAVGFAVSTALIAREQWKTQAAYEQLAREQKKTQTAYEAEARERDRAEKSFRQARQAVDFFAVLAEEELADKPELQGLRRKLLQTCLDYYQDFIVQSGDDPAIQSDLAASHLRMANILDAIGQKEAAQAAAVRASQIEDKRPGDSHPPPGPPPRPGWPRESLAFLLLGQKSVQQDLKLAPEQTEKVERLASKRRALTWWESRNLGPDEVRARFADQEAQEKAMVDGLQEAQGRRLKQIVWQQRGGLALADPEVAAALELTPAQQEKVRGLLEEMLHRGRGRGGPRRGWSEPLLNLLTDAQRAEWNEMTGEPFKGELRLGFGGPPPGPGRDFPRHGRP
jgi:serine/threonine protein kinase